ncbi:hypothetical protein AtNW77_Chr4g0290941 [Arabidopsis thaliana]
MSWFMLVMRYEFAVQNPFSPKLWFLFLCDKALEDPRSNKVYLRYSMLCYFVLTIFSPNQPPSNYGE